MKAKMNNFSCWIEDTDSENLRNYFASMLVASGFKILDTVEHQFKPQGYTALFLLSESHFAIHTFPERGKTYIELTSCVDAPYEAFINTFGHDTVEPDE